MTAPAALEAVRAAFESADAQLREARAGAAAIAARAEEAKLSLERTALFAPFDGVVALMNIREGDYVAGPTPDPSPAIREASAAVVVMDDRRFEVELHLPPHEADRVREGQRALIAPAAGSIADHVRENAAASAVLEGEVWSVSPSISLQRRTVTVKVRAVGAPGLIRDGAYVSVWIAAAEATDALAIPYGALIADAERMDRAQVFVIDPQGDTVALRPVALGLWGLERVEVTSGLAVGERLVAAGHHRLRAGARVRIIADAADNQNAIEHQDGPQNQDAAGARPAAGNGAAP